MRQDYSGLHFHHRQFPVLRQCAATRPPPLVEADKLLLAYQGPKQHSTASKPGANRPEAPINFPNSQFCRTLDAHFLYRRLYGFVYKAVLTASLICLISRNYMRYG